MRTSDGVEYRVRPIRPDDAQREREFIAGLSPQSRYQRFLHNLREPGDALIAQLVHVDGHRTMALVAVVGTATTTATRNASSAWRVTPPTTTRNANSRWRSRTRGNAAAWARHWCRCCSNMPRARDSAPFTAPSWPTTSA
jgi:hypothetical protein